MPPAGGLQQQRGLVGAFPGLRRFLAPFLWLLLLAVVYADPLFVRRNFAGRDLLGYNLPIEKAVHDSYARGRWPVWLADVSGGRPLLPNINVGALYPVRPLLSLVPFPFAMRIYPILHWAVAGLGVFSLLRVLGASPSAGWAAAAAFVFSGVGVSEIFYTNHHPGFALLPWIVWSVARPAAGFAGRIVVSSLLMGLDLLAGDVFTMGAAVAAALLWILLEEKRGLRAASFAAFGVSITLAMLLALPQLVATALWIPETHRAIAGMKLSESFRFSVPVWRLFELVVPYPFGPTWSDEPRATWAPRAFGGYAMGFFATLYCGSFALIATVTSWRRKEKGLAFARTLALLAVAACVLPSLWPEAWLDWKAVLPLRYPEKMAVALALAGALFAGKAFDRFASEGSRRWPIVLGATLAFAALAAAAAPIEVGRAAARALGGRADAAASHLGFALAEAGLLWMAAVLALDRLRKPGRLNRFAALLLVALAPLAATRRIAQSFGESDALAPTAFARAIDRRDPSRSFRTLGESRYLAPSSFERAQLSADVGFLEYRRRSWLFYTPALWGRGVVWNDDFDAGDLFRAESLRRLSFHAANFADPVSFFGNVSLRFGIRFPDQPPPPGFRPFGGTGSEAWDENARALADVRLLGRWREAADAVDALRQIPIGSEVTLETGRTALGSARQGSLRVLEKTPEVLRAEVDVPEPTYLFVLRGYWSYHSVSVDGRPVSVIPAQLAFSAVPIPEGRHRIEWLETVPGGRLSRWGPVAFVLAVLVLFALERRSEKRELVIRRQRLAVGLFVLLVLVVFSDPLFRRRNFGGRDLLGYHLPIEKAVHDAYQRGRLPVWISEISGGRPLAANPNVGAFYPVRPLLSLFPFPLAMRIYPVAHWVFSGVGMILLLRLLGVSASGAWLGAATYVFSGVSLTEAFYTNNHPGVTLLPWIIWSVARPAPLTRRVLICSTLLGLDFLAGDLFTIAIALAAAALWIALEAEPQRRLVGWVALAASAALGGLLALPQIAAAVLWTPHTERAVSGLRLGEALELSISPLRLIELLIPFPFGATWALAPREVWGTAALGGRASGFFSSLYAGALPVIAVIATRRSSARGRRFSQALIGLGLLVAVPGSFLPDAWKGWSAPLPLRHPEKCAVAIVLGLAILAALGWDCLRERGRVPIWTLLVGGGLAALAAASRLFPLALGHAAAGIAGGSEADGATAAAVLAGSIAEGGLLWMMAVVALGLSSRQRSGLAISLILLTAVPIAANRKIAQTFREEEVFAPTAFARALQRADPGGSYRTLAIPASPAPDAEWAGSDQGRLEYWRRGWLYFTPCLWGRGTVFNQDADVGDLSRATSLRRVATLAAGFTDSSAFFGDLALRWEVRFRGEPARAGYHRIGGDLLEDWDEHERAFPDIRLLSRWREERNAVSALLAVPRLAAGEIVIETGRAGAGASVPGRIRMLEKTPERVRLETDATAPTWLFLLRGYFPFREVLLDGRAVEVAPAQLAFSAIPVPAGRHLLDWRERLPGARASVWGPIFFFLAAAALLARGGWGRGGV